MFFIIISLIAWGLYAYAMKRRLKEEFRLYNAILPLVIFSIIACLSLGINYVASAIPSINDGIGIHSSLAYCIIEEDSWSVNIFKKYFDYSMGISIILLTLYSGLRIVKN